jgi:hypothetical protein
MHKFRVRRTGHVECKGHMKNAGSILVGEHQYKKLLERFKGGCEEV